MAKSREATAESNEPDAYSPERALLDQLHLRFDQIMAEYNRDGKTDGRTPGLRISNGETYRTTEVMRSFMAPDGSRIRLNASGPRHVKVVRGVKTRLAPIDAGEFSVTVEVESPGQRGYAAAPNGQVSAPPAEPHRQRYRAEENQGGVRLCELLAGSEERPLNPSEAEQLLWLIQDSTLVVPHVDKERWIN